MLEACHLVGQGEGPAAAAPCRRGAFVSSESAGRLAVGSRGRGTRQIPLCGGRGVSKLCSGGCWLKLGLHALSASKPRAARRMLPALLALNRSECPPFQAAHRWWTP